MRHVQCDANAKVPNANYIPPVCVVVQIGSLGGPVGSPRLCIGSLRVFRYQHVGIGKGRRQNSQLLASAKMLQHPTALYSFTYISLLQLAAEYGGCS